MILTGNYWLELLAKEKNLKKEIETAIKKHIGRKFYNYEDMTAEIKNNVKIQIENYGVKYRMGIFSVEYDVDLKYDSKFVLNGFVIKFVFLNEEIW